MRFASTSPCHGGMGKAAIGSTMACQCMLRLTGNQKMAVRSRMLPVMIRLKVFKTAEEENASVVTDDDGNNHGSNVLKFLVEPWVRMDHCVCADSYFAFVNAVTVMRTMGLHFIGVVKMATEKFPMSYLSNLELVQHGDYKGLVVRGTLDGLGMLLFRCQCIIIRFRDSVFL